MYTHYDFERAAINAFEYHFPNITSIGCYFHYGQSIYRKLVKYGLKTQYTTDESFQHWVKCIIALALLPIDKVSDAYIHLVETAPDYDALTRENCFLDYVTNTYIEKDNNAAK